VVELPDHRRRARGRAGHGLLHLGMDRAAGDGAGRIRAADLAGRSHATCAGGVAGRDRHARRRLQLDVVESRADDPQRRAVAGEAQVGHRYRRHAFAHGHRSSRRAAQHHRRHISLDRQAERRRTQDYRQRRSAFRVVRGDVVVDAGDGGVDGGGQPSHRHALGLGRGDRVGDARDGVVDQRSRSERRIPDELRDRDVVVDGRDERIDCAGRDERGALVRPDG
jgi:hypothetical protein